MKEIFETNPFDIAIMHLLQLANRPLSTLQIAERTGMTWTTAKKHLEQLRRQRIVTRMTRGSAIYWEAKAPF